MAKGGKYGPFQFRMGHTVDWLKRVVEEKYHIPYHSHVCLLFFGKLKILKKTFW